MAGASPSKTRHDTKLLLDKELAIYHSAVSDVISLPFCTKCKLVQNSAESLVRHVKKTHGSKVRPRLLKGTLQQRLAFCPTDPQQRSLYLTAPGSTEHPTGSLKALIEFPIYKEGLRCPFCLYFSPKPDSIRKHVSGSHKKTSSEVPATSYPRVPFLQCLIAKPIRYFPVYTDPHQQPTAHAEGKPSHIGLIPDKNASSNKELAYCAARKRLIVLNEASEGRTSVPGFFAPSGSVNSQLQYFYSITHLHKIVEPHKPSVILPYIAPPSTTLENTLVHLVAKYFQKAVELTRDAPSHLKNRFNPTNQSGGGLKFDSVQNGSSKSYAAKVAKASLMALRRFSDPRFQSLPPLPQDLNNAISCLQQKLMHGTPGAEAIQSVHNVQKCIFLSKIAPNAKISKLFIRHCAAFTLVRPPCSGEEYTFYPDHTASKTFAGMKYACRITALWEIMMCSDDRNPDSQAVHDASAGYSAVFSRISTQENTAYALIDDYLHKCRIGERADAPSNFDTCPTHEQCHIVGGDHLSVSQFRECTRKLQKKVQVRLEHLLLNVKIPLDVIQAIENATDEMENNSSGFSFILSSTQKVKGRKAGGTFLSRRAGTLLYDHVIADPCLNERFLDPNATSASVEGSSPPPSTFLKWKTQSISQYLSSCVEFLKSLLALVHLTGGAPPRGTEEYTHKLRNISVSQRTLYNYEGLVLLLLRYNKNRHLLRRDDPIPRFLDLSSGELIKKYVTLVRPFEVYLLNVLHNEDPSKMSLPRAHRDHLFVEQGIAFSSATITEAVSQEFREVGIPYNYRQYRHYALGLMRDYVEHRLWCSLPFSHQAGHGKTTAQKHYALSQEALQTTPKDLLFRFLLCSIAWHRFLGLMTIAYPTGTASFMEGACKDCENSSQVSSGTEPSTKVSGNEREIPTNASNAGTTAQQCLHTHNAKTPSISGKRAHPETPSAPLSAENDIAKRQRQSYPPPNAPYRSSPSTAASALYPTSLPDYEKLFPSLKQFMQQNNTLSGHSSVKFKSTHQQAAISVVHEGKQDILVVLPTGGGKSLVFMLPSFMEQETNQVTIVIVPLRALAQDLHKRCIELGLCVGTWEERHYAPCPSILILAVEHLQTPEYAKLIGRLDQEGLLRRIVFDEVHLTLLWSTFRTCMHSISALIRPNWNVPLIMLSATVPPNVEHLLVTHLGATSPLTIRAFTTRPNLKYEVLRSEKVHEEIVNIVCHALKSLGQNERIIVYAQTRKEAQLTRDILCKRVGEGTVELYHAGLDTCERALSQTHWNANGSTYRVMVATSAFGAGIDFPSVRLVVHVGFSRSLIEFAQESGRAGRDGNPARSVVVYSSTYVDKYGRLSLHEGSLEWTNGEQLGNLFDDGLDLRCVLDTQQLGLQNFISWAENRLHCRRQALFKYLDGSASICHLLPDAEPCDVCSKTKISSSPCSYLRVSETNMLAPPDAWGTLELPAATPACADVLRDENTSIVTPEKECRNKESEEALYCFQSKVKSLWSHWKDSRTSQEIEENRSQGPCVACFAENTLEHGKRGETYCSYKYNRCIRCFDFSHRVKDSVPAGKCKLKIQRNRGRCYKCGLFEFCESVRFHSKRGENDAPGFGHCQWWTAWELALYLWHTPKHQIWIVTNFTMTQNSGTESFQRWLLRSFDGVPNLISLFNLWYKTNRVVCAPKEANFDVSECTTSTIVRNAQRKERTNPITGYFK